MDHNRGNPMLLRHLELLKDVDHTSPRSFRDVIGGDDWEGPLVERLARLAGGIDALEALTTAPLPLAEPFDAADINSEDLPAVDAVIVALHDHQPQFDELIKHLRIYGPGWLEDEYITILHRLVARAARRGVTQWHRDPRRMAAAFVWLALGGNDALGRGRKERAQHIWRWYAVSDCRALARRLCVDAQLGSLCPSDEEPLPLSDLRVVFGDKRMLHSAFRAFLIKERNALQKLIADNDRRRSSQRPVRLTGDGQIEMRARQIQPMWAYKGTSDAGRASVMVAFGRSTDDDDYELLGLSVPDARVLLRMLQEALDAPALAR